MRIQELKLVTRSGEILLSNLVYKMYRTYNLYNQELLMSAYKEINAEYSLDT